MRRKLLHALRGPRISSEFYGGSRDVASGSPPRQLSLHAPLLSESAPYVLESMNDFRQLLTQDDGFLHRLPLGYVAVRKDGTVTSVNSFLASSLGYVPAELIGVLAAEFPYSADDRQAFHQQLAHRAGGAVGSYAIRLRGRHDRCLSVSCFGVPEYGEDGSYWGSRGIVVPFAEAERLAGALLPDRSGATATQVAPMSAFSCAPPPEARPSAPEAREVQQVLSVLTRRERDVVQLLRSGLRVQGIAECLNLSHYTVRNHLKRVFRKAAVTSQGELLMKLNRPALGRGGAPEFSDRVLVS